MEAVNEIFYEDFDEVCRICLQKGEADFPICTTLIDNLSIDTVLEYSFSIKVYLEDKLPQNICMSCISEIYRTYNVKKRYLSNEEGLKKALEAYEEEERGEEDRKEDDIVNAITSTLQLEDIKEEIDMSPEAPIIDMDTNHLFDKAIKIEDDTEDANGFNTTPRTQKILIPKDSNIPSLENAVKRLNDEHQMRLIKAFIPSLDVTKHTKLVVTKDSVWPTRCPCVGTEDLEMIDHSYTKRLRSRSPDTENKNIGSIDNAKNQRLCSMSPDPKNKNPRSVLKNRLIAPKPSVEGTETVFGEKRELSKNERILCPSCGKLIVKGRWVEHNRIHTGEKPYPCDECPKRFNKSRCLLSHKASHSKERPFECVHCHTRFKVRGSWRRHMKANTCREDRPRSHTPRRRRNKLKPREANYTCKYCGLQFKVINRYKSHLENHSTDTLQAEIDDLKKLLPHDCSLCNLSFSTLAKLDKHNEVHSMRKCLCSICGKSFIHEYNLNKHMLSHTGEKPFSCAICNKAFTAQNSLNSHMSNHTGVLPFKCQFCNRGFKERALLKRHLLNHTNERQYACFRCGKKFKTRAHLKTHLISHTGERPYKCNECSNTYKTQTGLQLHKKKH